MTDEQAFLDLLKDHPADETTRLVYADWLDDRSEAAKATYLRRVVDLVRLAPGSGEYSDAAAGLLTVAGRLDAAWRSVAGGRFDLVLVRYDPARKIPTIKIIRELTYWMLADAKGFVESAPAALRVWAPFENLFPELVRFAGVLFSAPPRSDRGNGAVIRPSVWPCGTGPEATFNVVLTRLTEGALEAVGEDSEDDYRRASLIRGVTEVLGVSPEEALLHLRQLPLTLATGLRPPEVAARVRDLWVKLNVYRTIAPDGIQMVPRR